METNKPVEMKQVKSQGGNFRWVAVSALLLATWPNTLRKDTRPMARSISLTSGRMALLVPSRIGMPDGAPPPSGTSAMTADWISWIWDEVIAMRASVAALRLLR